MEISSQIDGPTALPLEKGPSYFLSTKLGTPQRPSGRFGEEKNLWLLPGIESYEVCKWLLWIKLILRK
jgi:hypothetical protein